MSRNDATSTLDLSCADAESALEADDAAQLTNALEQLRATLDGDGEVVLPCSTVKALCTKLRHLQWQAANGQEETALLSTLCTVLALGSRNPDVRRYVRTEGGLKTLVQLLDNATSDSVLVAVAHALMLLSVDPMNKNALRACGVVEQVVELLTDRDLPSSHLLFGCLLNLAANSLSNVVVMIDSGLHELLEKRLRENRFDAVSTSRAQLLLTSLHACLLPLVSPDGGETEALYDVLKREKGDDPDHLTHIFDKALVEHAALLQTYLPTAD